MNIAIISSIKDTASMNIKENLINNFKFNKTEEQFGNNDIFQFNLNNEKNNKMGLYTIDSELIYADELDKKIDSDVFVFISKHRAEEERANLTIHPIGNFGKALVGGKDNKLCISPSSFLKNIFLELNKNVENTEYEATLEATHHGPYIEKPVLFLELGSTEKQWEDFIGGKIVAQSLINALKNSNYNFINNKQNISTKKSNNKIKNEGNEYESTLIIGGGHYNHVANKVMLQSDVAVGHICPKYNFANLNEEMLKQAMEKIIPRPKFVLLDWKGLGKEKQRILDMLEKNGIEYKRSDRFFW